MKHVLAQVVGLTSPHGVQDVLAQIYVSQSKACALNTRIALANTQKGNVSIVNYVGKMRSLADVSPLAVKRWSPSYVLAGIGSDYESIVMAFVAWVEPISVAELFSQLLSFEC
jgi:hypothetical protein